MIALPHDVISESDWIEWSAGYLGAYIDQQRFGRRNPGTIAIPRIGIVMSGCLTLIRGYFWRCADRGCGHVFGLFCAEIECSSWHLI